MRNKCLYFITVFVWLATGCIEEEFLEPFVLPELVNTHTRKVEAFREHQSLFVAAEGGVLVRYADGEQYAFETPTVDRLDAVDWTEAQVFYSDFTERFWVVNDSLIFEFGRAFSRTYLDSTSFYSPTDFYVSYALSPDGTLYRVGFYDEVWDPSNGFFSDYMIGIYAFQGEQGEMWRAYETDLSVSSEVLGVPSATFNSTGELLIVCNPVYWVSGLQEGSISADTLAPLLDRRSIANPYWNEDESTINGLLRPADWFNPSWLILEHQLDQAGTNTIDLQTECQQTEHVVGPVKLLNQNDDEMMLFIQVFSSELTEEREEVGFIYTYSYAAGTCSIEPISPDDILLPYSNLIEDLDVLGNEVYIGTETGLLVYDQLTKSVEPYLKKFFLENTQ